MWKPGQLVTLNGKLYRITRCDYEIKNRICSFCQQVNMKMPCLTRFDFPENVNFERHTCSEKMPETCYPKVFSKSS